MFIIKDLNLFKFFEINIFEILVYKADSVNLNRKSYYLITLIKKYRFINNTFFNILK